MTLPDLHPDELVRRASQNQITPAERADLTAHFERCPACALELAMRTDAARAALPSAADHAIAARIVERVLASKESTAMPRAGRLWSERLPRVALIALMLTSTAVGASAVAIRLRDRPAARVADAPQIEPAAGPASAARRPRRDLAPALPDPQPPGAGTATEDVRVPPAQAIGPDGPVRSTPAERNLQPRARAEAVDALLRKTAPVQPPPLGNMTPSPDRADAAAVFARAEEARLSGRFGDAARLYEDLAARFPGSREEVVARVLHGQLLLEEMRDPAAALRWFERYLASEPTGALAEEVRLGRAQALRARGLPDEERTAWEELLRQHPASVHASAARARLAALRAP